MTPQPFAPVFIAVNAPDLKLLADVLRYAIRQMRCEIECAIVPGTRSEEWPPEVLDTLSFLVETGDFYNRLTRCDWLRRRMMKQLARARRAS